MEDRNTITGIILAGGKSSRMGYDKGLAIVNGKKMIEHVYAALSQVVDKVIIVANTDSYNYLNLPVFEDMYKEKGPVAGIYTGLFNSDSEKNIIVACDMPFVTPELFAELLERSPMYDIVVPTVNGNLEPLCGYYKKEILEQLQELIEMDVLPVHKVIEFFENYKLDVKDTDLKQANNFANINKPEDIEQIEKSELRKKELNNNNAINSTKLRS